MDRPAAAMQRERGSGLLPVEEINILAGVTAEERDQIAGAVPGADSQIIEHHAALAFRAYRLSRSRLQIRHCRCPPVG